VDSKHEVIDQLISSNSIEEIENESRIAHPIESPPPLRRSTRRSSIRQAADSTVGNLHSHQNTSNLERRRSSRLLERSMNSSNRSTEIRSSKRIRTKRYLPAHMEMIEEIDVKPEIKHTHKKTKKQSDLDNTILDGYLNGSITNTKTNLLKHRKAILDLLNTGSVKQLQILPHVGQKTAFQILTSR